jgi:hypothetical protein
MLQLWDIQLLMLQGKDQGLHMGTMDTTNLWVDTGQGLQVEDDLEEEPTIPSCLHMGWGGWASGLFSWHLTCQNR